MLPLPKLPPNLKGIYGTASTRDLDGVGTASLRCLYLRTISGIDLADLAARALNPIAVALADPPLGRRRRLRGADGQIAPLVLPTHQALHNLEQRGGATPDKVRTCFRST